MELFSQKMQRAYLLSMIALMAFLSVCGYYKKQRLERQARKAASVKTITSDLQTQNDISAKNIVEVSSQSNVQAPTQKKQETVQEQQPKQSEEAQKSSFKMPQPLSQTARRHILRLAYMSVAECTEKKCFSFYRCSNGRETIGYGCNVRANPSRIDNIDIFYQPDQKGKVELIQKIKNAKTKQERENLINNLVIEGSKQSKEYLIDNLTKLSATDLARQLKKLKITQKLDTKQKEEFKKKLRTLSKSDLSKYSITEESAQKLYNPIFNEVIGGVESFLSDEKGNTFFYDLPFQWQLVCIDIAYNIGITGFNKFNNLKNNLKDKDYAKARNEISTHNSRRLAIRKIILDIGDMAFDYFLTFKNTGERPAFPNCVENIKAKNYLDLIEIKSMTDMITLTAKKAIQIDGNITEAQLKDYEDAQAKQKEVASASTLKSTLENNKQQPSVKPPTPQNHR